MRPNEVLIVMETILITGGAGFIGTNFVEYFAQKYPAYRLIDLDAMTYAANKEAFPRQAKLSNVIPIHGDVCDESAVRDLMEEYDVTGVIHFAAESHVDNSIADPMRFVFTNIHGTTVMLDAALRYWQRTGRLASSRFHHVSTDEVFGTLGETGFFDENSAYAPNSPYSASKAASDLMARSYAKTYGMNVTLSNCSNNYGPWQHDEKLIPTIIRRCLAHTLVPLYGNGLNVRDWLWVNDHCRALDLIFHQAALGARYNVGGHCERSNLDIAEGICRLLDEMLPWSGHQYRELITFVDDRPGHDFRYAVDAQKLERDLGWEPTMPFLVGLKQTVEWYLARYKAAGEI